MIMMDIRSYDYLTFGEKDEYGQPQMDETPKGQVKMAIYVTSQITQDNVLYENATYIGLTNDAGIDDKYVILDGNERLKVLYVQPKGRFKQVFMARM